MVCQLLLFQIISIMLHLHSLSVDMTHYMHLELLENRFNKSSIKLSEQLISNGFPVVEARG